MESRILPRSHTQAAQSFSSSHVFNKIYDGDGDNSNSNGNISKSVAKQSSSLCSGQSTAISLDNTIVCVFGTAIAIVAFNKHWWSDSVPLSDFSNVLAIVIQDPPSPSDSLLSFIHQMPKVQQILLSSAVSGYFVPEIFQQPSLSFLEVIYSPNLVGSIPTNTTISDTLQFLRLDSINIYGSLPDAIYSLPSLGALQIVSCGFSGTISPRIGNISTLTIAKLNGNSFEGSIPSQFGKLSKLGSVDVSNNKLTGAIPSQLGTLTSLHDLSVNDNRLSGSIPSQLGKLTQLLAIHLSNASLSGTLPSQLGLLTHLKELWLSNQSFHGTLPSELESRATAGYLALSCDYSGVDSHLCARYCQPCHFFDIEFTTCDPQGFGQKCIPAYMFLPLLIVCIALIAIALKRVSPPLVSRNELIGAVLMSSLAIATLAANFAFAIHLLTNSNNSGSSSNAMIRAIGYTSLCAIGVTIWVNFGVSISVINQIVTEVDGIGKFVNLEFRNRIFGHISFLAMAVTFCAMSLRTLAFVIGPNQFRTTSWIKIKSSLTFRQPLGSSHSTDSSSAIIRNTNYDINHNTNYDIIRNTNYDINRSTIDRFVPDTQQHHHQQQQQQQQQQTRQSSPESVGLSLIKLVRFLNVFENLPQFFLQLAALTLNKRELAVVIAFLLSTLTIVSDTIVVRIIEICRKDEKFNPNPQQLGV